MVLRRRRVRPQETLKKVLCMILAAILLLSVSDLSAYAEGKAPLERYANCSVDMLDGDGIRTTSFHQEATTIGYRVRIDDEIPSGTLTVYAYPGTVGFDPDSSATMRLASKTVTDGEQGVFQTDLSTIPVGYRIRLGLYVNLDGDDYFRTVASAQSFEVVDESGQGFEDYTYPDAVIDEKELTAGTEKLHLTLTGDERIFAAARENKLSVSVAVGQYPADESFDFEGKNQISLASIMSIEEPFAGREVTLSEPLRAGYRVRAVVYWSQNKDLFVPKGNDYEEMFQRPDDSVLIEKAAEEEPAAEDAETVKDFSVDIEESITTETTDIDVKITAKEGMENTSLYIVGLCRVDENGKADITDPDSYIVRVFGKKAGVLTLSGINGLSEGEKLRVLLRYGSADGDIVTLESEDYVVTAPLAEESFVISETSFRKGEGKATATVTVSGHELYQGDYIRLTIGTKTSENDADSRTSIGSMRYTAPGTYKLTFDAAKLVGGQTVQAYLYHYDGDADRTYYTYSNAVEVEKEAVQPEVTIETRNVTNETKSLYISAKLEGGALLAVYAHAEEEFDASALAVSERSGFVGAKYLSEAPGTSVKVDLTKELVKGQKLTAVIWQNGLTGDMLAQSKAILVNGAPEKEKPTAYIRDKKVTAGMTKLVTSMLFDKSVENAAYKLYQFTGDSLDTQKDPVIASGKLYKGVSNQDVYVGSKLIVGSKLQLVLTADGIRAESNVLTVEPSPDWGTPTVAFAVDKVQTDSKSIPITVEYSDEYLSMGEDFYCDITIYRVPGTYTDQEIEDKELWENTRITTSVAKANSHFGKETRGELTLPVQEGKELTAGDRLFIKLRLPHTEWKDEEVDYISSTISILAAKEETENPSPEEQPSSEEKPVTYTMLKGNGQTVNRGEAASFTSEAEFGRFVKVQVDGKDVDPSNYTAKSGSAMVTLSADYVKTLAAGTHRIAIISRDGEATGEFTVQAASEKDKDSSKDKESGKDKDSSKDKDSAKGKKPSKDKTKSAGAGNKRTGNQNSKTPKTGDSGQYVLWLVLMMVSLSLVGLTVIRRRR